MGTRSLTTKGKDGKDISWRIEEIENGYIIEKQWYEEKKNGDTIWMSKKYFSDDNPLDGFKPNMDIIENSLKD